VLIFGKYRKKQGAYYDTLKSTYGCDSLITITALKALIPPSPRTVDTTVCQNKGYFAQGKMQYQTGTYFDTLKNYNGCDSSIITNLMVQQLSVGNRQLAICAGDSVLIAGKYCKQSGVYSDTIAVKNSCDSIVVTNLTVQQLAVSSQQLTICDKDSVLIFGKYRKQQGVYNDTIHIKDKCDSILTTNLIVEVCELEIPNVFTPNSDGINDYFVIKGIDQIPSSISIYNRWGRKVFENNNYHNEWDGANLADGVYYYVVRDKKRNKVYTGVVEIVR